LPRRSESHNDEPVPRRRPATTPDARESQMIDLADKLAEKQLRDGTASSQVITHYLKLGSSRERLEKERLEIENRLAEAKIEQLASQKRVEELYAKALTSMRSYRGLPPESDEPESDDGYYYDG
jgi:hypothetical protein